MSTPPMPTHVLPTTYTIRCTFIHRSSRTVILFKLLNERLSCTEMYITDEALVEHSVSYLVQKCTLQILYINVHNRSRPRCITYYKNRRTVDVADLLFDASTLDNSISSVVNKVGLLTTERMELFSCVDCA
jgi:hypothetical protein